MSKLPKVMNEDFQKIMSSKTNDNYLCMYVGSIVKGIINIHNLLNNRIQAVEDRHAEILEKEKNEMRKADQDKDEKIIEGQVN